VDLVGTCYDLLHKPYPIYQRHVDMLRHRVIMGSHKGNDEEKEGGNKKENTAKKMTMSGMQKTGGEEGVELNDEIPIDDPNFVARHKEMFLECNSVCRGVYFKEDLLDFGFTQSAIKSEAREITIVNSLNYDVTVYWIIPGVPSTSNKPNFQVNNASFDIPKQSEKSVKVVFTPTDSNVYYYHKLQCYAFRKTGHENQYFIYP